MTDYKDQFTLDGRLKPAHPSVTRAKVAEADKLLKAALRGDKIASGQLAEVHTTSDLPFSIAHLISSVVLPQFDKAERSWSQVAGIRTVPTFDNIRLYSLYSDVTGAGVHGNGGLNTVPEGAPYPHITVSGREAFYKKLAKLGARFSMTWETGINDIEGFYDNVPSELIELALDTEEREVYEALATASNSIAGGTLPDGTVVTANPTLTPNAIWQAIIELANVEVNGRKVGRSSNGYNVVVGVGQAEYINWKINQAILQIQDGSITFGPGDRSALNGVSIVETAHVTGDDWYILPKLGGTRRPVLELLRLRGYEAPELRVNNLTGNYVGGSAVPPFEGSFENDTVDYRVRYVCGGALWDDSFVRTSDSSGS